MYQEQFRQLVKNTLHWNITFSRSVKKRD